MWLRRWLGDRRGGEGGEAMLAVVGKVVRMAWFVERRVWLWWWKAVGLKRLFESGWWWWWGCGWWLVPK